MNNKELIDEQRKLIWQHYAKNHCDFDQLEKRVKKLEEELTSSKLRIITAAIFVALYLGAWLELLISRMFFNL
jgi:hypothetical protein